MTSAYLKFLTLTLFGSLALMPFCAMAEDIDIFVGSSGGSASSSNVLIVLDNTSNWSANNQGWAGGITQGQAEVNALKQLIYFKHRGHIVWRFYKYVETILDHLILLEYKLTHILFVEHESGF